MGGHKRSTRRNRRDALRRHLPAQLRTPDHHHVTNPNSEVDELLVPGWENFLIGMLEKISIELTPLYAAIAVAHQALGKRPLLSPVIASAQFVEALKHLNLNAELIIACTSILRSGQDGSEIVDIGVWDHLPQVHDDGTTDAHAVIWSNSFNRCIDIGVCQNQVLQQASTAKDNLCLPVILPSPHGREKLLYASHTVTTIRPPFSITWMFFPDWSFHLNPFLKYHAPIIAQGGLAMAHAVVDLLATLALCRDTKEIDHLYPSLSAFIGGRTLLPTLNVRMS